MVLSSSCWSLVTHRSYRSRIRTNDLIVASGALQVRIGVVPLSATVGDRGTTPVPARGAVETNHDKLSVSVGSLTRRIKPFPKLLLSAKSGDLAATQNSLVRHGRHVRYQRAIRPHPLSPPLHTCGEGDGGRGKGTSFSSSTPPKTGMHDLQDLTITPSSDRGCTPIRHSRGQSTTPVPARVILPSPIYLV